MRPIALFLLILSGLISPIPSAAADFTSEAGPGSAVLDDDGMSEELYGYLFMHGDEEYENGYAWRYGGLLPPDYGAFAECYSTNLLDVSAAVFDFTQTGGQTDKRMEVYFWDDDGGIPGNVLRLIPDVDPGPIAFWPDVSRHVIDMVPSVYPTGEWWVGFRGDWYLSYAGWYVAADIQGSGEEGCAMTNITPDIGYPPGWQPVDIVWGPTRALGIGFLGRSPDLTDVGEDPPVERSSWGEVKSLFR